MAAHTKAYKGWKPLGHGENADVYPFDRPRKPSKVIRVPRREPHDIHGGITPEREALERYRRHQVAHLLFPDHNLRVTALNPEDLGMVSDFVHRPMSNKRFSVLMRTRGGIWKGGAG